MSYQTKVEQYINGELSAVEQMAFEHELKDNENLRQAYEAELLFDDLVTFVGNHAPNPQPTAATPPTSSVGKSRYIVWGGLFFLGILGFIYGKQTFTATTPVKTDLLPLLKKEIPSLPIPERNIINIEFLQKNNSPSKEKKRKNAPSNRPKIKPSDIPFATNKKAIKDPFPMTRNIQKTATSTTIVSVSETVAPTNGNIIGEQIEERANGIVLTSGFSISADEAFSVELKGNQSIISQHHPSVIESSEKVSQGNSLTYSAGEAIIMKPGFHIEQGASFAAKIDRD